MSRMAVCPRCHTLLSSPAENKGNLRCDKCLGTYTPPVEKDIRLEAPEVDTAAALENPGPEPHIVGTNKPGQLGCPSCLSPMTDLGGSVGHSCPQCGATWQDGASHEPVVSEVVKPEPPPESPPVAAAEESTLSRLTGSVLYGLSLPERTVRGAVGLTAGAVKELADAVVPSAFKDSTSYKIAIDNSLGFLTETIGGIPGKAKEVSDDATEAGEHLAKKAVGNFVDMAGLAMLHVSPMWVLAVVSDVAYGTKSYTLELAKELEAAGLIDDTSTIHNVDDILDAVQRTTGTAASTFDKPPFSIAEMRQTITETRENLSQADLRRLVPESELGRYWTEMQTAASEENVSLLGLSGAVAMQTLDRVKGIGQGTVVGLKVAGNIVNRTIFTHYRESLGRIQEKGLVESVRESYGPYVEAVWSNFSSAKKSWTESLLDPGNIGKLFGKVTGLLGGAESDETEPS